jgi:signal peptidase I
MRESATDDKPAEEPTSGLLGRLRRRRRDEDDADEPFTLPEPDASLESTLSRAGDVPRPTREWARPIAVTEPEVPTQPEPDDADEPVIDEPRPDERKPKRPRPGPKPGPRGPTPPSTAAGAISTPTSSPEPSAVPDSPTARPKPRPTPGRAQRQSSTGRLGVAGANSSTGTGAPSSPFGGRPPAAPSGASSVGGGATTVGRISQPDLSRFLDAAEAKPGEDEKDDNDDQPKRLGRVRRTLMRTGIILLIAVIAAALLRAFVVQPYYIPSASMEPTLHGCVQCNDDHVLVDKLSYRAHDVRAGDIVVFKRPPGVNAEESVLIKRVIGLPRDSVRLQGGKVLVNRQQITETYVNKKCPGGGATVPEGNTSSWTVPSGSVFVMGDNRCNSVDSRTFGPIPTSTIIGRAFAIIWPFSRMRLL